MMRRIPLSVIIFFLYTFCFAQQSFKKVNGVKVESFSNATGLPLVVSVDESKKIPVNEFPVWMQNEFTNSKDISFSILSSEKDHLGYTHSRFHEYYKQYGIESSMLIVHSKNNAIQSFNGDWYKDIIVSNTILLSEQQALQYALNKINAQKYKWDNLEEEAHMREVLKKPDFTYKPLGEIVVLPLVNKNKKTFTYVYVYKFNIYAEKPLYRANVYVDALSGKIVKEQNLICTIDAVGTANTKYSGVKAITTDSYLGMYRLTEAGRGGGIKTYNLNNGTAYASNDFTNTVNTWTSTGIDQAATDAHWGAEMTYDYYDQMFSRNSIDNAGLPLLSYVHYDVNYVNAFWDGQRMTYGDGDLPQGFDVMTALDICGHEITHGVVEYTALLSGGEADALNEAFADIFGTSIEWYARPTQNDWIMGSDNSTGIRNMSSPKQMQQPDTYKGQNWDLGDEPHTNNGPCIYWYYLLSVGGNGTNDNNDAYNVTGITMTKASAIAYRALTVYMTPNTDYANVRNYTIQAAKDLYGACSNECIQTINAWHAVGVGTSYLSGVVVPDFTANKQADCMVPVTVNFSNTSNGAAGYIWDFGDGNTSTATNPSHTYTVGGSYTVKLVGIGCTPGVKDSIIKNNYINLGSNNPCVYNMSNVVSTYSVCTGKLYDNGGANANYSNNTYNKITIVATPGSSITLNFASFGMEDTYDFLKIYRGTGTSGLNLIGSYTGNSLPNGGFPIIINTNIISIVQTSDPLKNDIGFELNWSCSTSAVGIHDIIAAPDDAILTYPNPSYSSVTFSNIDEVQFIELLNSLGQIVYSVNVNKSNTLMIYIGNLPDGLYTAKLYAKEQLTTKKIIKQ